MHLAMAGDQNHHDLEGDDRKARPETELRRFPAAVFPAQQIGEFPDGEKDGQHEEC